MSIKKWVCSTMARFCKTAFPNISCLCSVSGLILQEQSSFQVGVVLYNQSLANARCTYDCEVFMAKALVHRKLTYV